MSPGKPGYGHQQRAIKEYDRLDRLIVLPEETKQKSLSQQKRHRRKVVCGKLFDGVELTH